MPLPLLFVATFLAGAAAMVLLIVVQMDRVVAALDYLPPMPVRSRRKRAPRRADPDTLPPLPTNWPDAP